MTECRVSVFNLNDGDNMMARMKFWQDWLQRSGYIENDRNLFWIIQPLQTIVRKSKARPSVLTDCFTFTIQTVRP